MSAPAERGRDFDGFDLRRQLEGQKDGRFPETLIIKDVQGNHYRIITMQGGTDGDVLVIERNSP